MTAPISIPGNWGRFISASFNRVYVNPASGCRARCKYCYIYEYGHPVRSRLLDVPATVIAEWISTTSGIIKGRTGFLISIGSVCDPFEPNVVETTIDLIKALAPLGNPIQISTKFTISEDQIDRITPCLNYPSQLVVFSTVTTFAHWRSFEPGADSPQHRLSFLGQLSCRNIPTCVAIKPFFPSLAGTELQRYAIEIESHKVSSVLVGSFYANDRMIDKVREEPALQEHFSPARNSYGPRPPPCSINESRRDIRDIDASHAIAAATGFFKAKGIPVFNSSPCVSAFFARTLCATGIWRYFPHLCVRCPTNCDEVFRCNTNALGLTFPNEVEGVKAHV